MWRPNTNGQTPSFSLTWRYIGQTVNNTCFDCKFKYKQWFKRGLFSEICSFTFVTRMFSWVKRNSLHSKETKNKKLQSWICVHSKGLEKLPVSQNYKAPVKGGCFSKKQFSRTLYNKEWFVLIFWCWVWMTYTFIMICLGQK